jgi:endonuclease/exonuclease/phosphatase family metal-dependent hydrolase
MTSERRIAASCHVRLEPDRHDELHPELDNWRANVGAPLAANAEATAPARIEGVDVLSWNVAIGMGRLDEVLARLRNDPDIRVGQGPERPLIVLVQEAFRTDDTIPPGTGTSHHGGRLPLAAQRRDIAAVALEHGLSLRYSPSMRNGLHPSDRGNAILSTVRLDDAHAFLLPYVRQRRVAVSARMAGHPDLTFVSAHLDTHGAQRATLATHATARPTARRSFSGGRAAQARALAATMAAIGTSVVLGADLNSVLGMSDPAIRELVAGGMHPARRRGNWRHTFHTPFRLLLDHVLYRSADGRIAHAEVTRLDEAPADRSRGVFGSDHHPLLARIELRSH